jgi:hypothetical protein
MSYEARRNSFMPAQPSSLSSHRGERLPAVRVYGPSIGQEPLGRIVMALICTALEPLIDWIDSRQICLGVIN